MNTKRFNEVIEDRLNLCVSVLCKKADEYATDDRLHNFKVAAKLQNCTPEKALAGMMCKHTVSVYDLINDLEKGKCATREMWEEKIGDSLNYLLLLTAMLEERFECESSPVECKPEPEFEPTKIDMTTNPPKVERPNVFPDTDYVVEGNCEGRNG